MPKNDTPVATELPFKTLDEFAARPNAFQHERQVNSIHAIAAAGKFIAGPLSGGVDSAYVLHLTNACAYPPWHIRQSNPTEDNSETPDGFLIGSRGLLVADGNFLLQDSFARGIFVPPGLKMSEAGHWKMTLPEIQNVIDRDCVWLETISAHFGHTIVENPSRMWVLLEEEFAKLDAPLFAAFATHSLSKDRSLWPDHLRHLFEAVGIPIDAIEVIDRPTRFRSLYVPKAISPYLRGKNIGPYSTLMSKTGAAISGKSNEPATSAKLYLSRSQLPAKGRFVKDGAESLVEDIFRDLGHQILHTQTMAFADQVAAVRRASHLAGCVGSQLHLAAFSDPGNLKLFRIAPSFFSQVTDNRIVESLGGSVTTFLVEQAQPVGPANIEPFEMSSAVLQDIKAAATAWSVD